MLELLLLEMKGFIKKAEQGKVDLKLGASIRSHSIDVEKEVKAERKALKEQD